MKRSRFLKILSASFGSSLLVNAGNIFNIDKRQYVSTLYKNIPKHLNATAVWSDDDDYVWVRAFRPNCNAVEQSVFVNVKTSYMTSLSNNDFQFLEEITRLADITRKHTGKSPVFEMIIHEKSVAGFNITFHEKY